MVKLKATCVKTIFEETKNHGNTGTDSKVNNTDEPEDKPWLKKLFDK